MRTARYINPKGGIYHVTVHTIPTKEPYPLTLTENERLYRLICAMSGFTGVRVLTHALMGNHFHLMLEVPGRPDRISEAEVIQRLNCLPKRNRSSMRPGDELARALLRCRELKMPESVAESMLNSSRARMFDLSRFMQELLSRFTQNYNLRHGRKGTLWDDRFHSTLVEPNRKAMIAVAAYIDLNPFRAGLCDRSLGYRFTGFTAARGGCQFAQEGLARLFRLCGAAKSPELEPSSLLDGYSVSLMEKILSDLSGNSDSMELIRVGRAKSARYRRRYLTRGKILGSRIFIEYHQAAWQAKQRLKHSPLPHSCPLGELHVIHPLRRPL